MVFIVDKVIVCITNLLENVGYADSSEVISLSYIMVLLIVFAIIVLLFDFILYKIKH